VTVTVGGLVLLSVLVRVSSQDATVVGIIYGLDEEDSVEQT